MSDDTLRRRITRAVGGLLTMVPALARGWGRQFDALRFEEVPFVRPRKPLARSRLALITTGGVHLREQPPFDMADPRGDPSYRAIPADTPPEQLTITHDYYDHRDAERDMNVLLPVDMVRRLVAEGKIGALGTSYSFMGHIEPPHVETLLRETAPQVARRLREEQVDAVLLTPA